MLSTISFMADTNVKSVWKYTRLSANLHL